MNKLDKFRKAESWFLVNEELGFSVELKHWKYNIAEHWNIYGYIFDSCDLYSCCCEINETTIFSSVLSKAPLHGGITYLAKCSEGDLQSIKFGCDYSHSIDDDTYMKMGKPNEEIIDHLLDLYNWLTVETSN